MDFLFKRFNIFLLNFKSRNSDILYNLSLVKDILKSKKKIKLDAFVIKWKKVLSLII